MANHKSAEKRARQTIKRQARNNATKQGVKTQEKILVKALDSKAKDTPEALKAFVSKIAKAARKGVIKKQTAARKIGRLSARVAQASSK